MSFVAIEGATLEGRYVLRALLGRGGMGTVWRADHVGLGTAVALKLVAVESEPDVVARFRREARISASLASANIVRIVDFGVEQETPFIAMELLEGETLRERLARGAVPFDEVARIMSGIGRGLDVAHRARVVHRDLKPENIFLARVDGDVVAKVLDFGVAKSVVPDDYDKLTRTGAVVGTLQYISPEQFDGRAVDERSDLYALAVIAFECVTGRAAFALRALGELYRAVCLAPLPIPSTIAPGVPPSFDAWFARAAHRDPAQRFESATAMADALSAAFSPR